MITSWMLYWLMMLDGIKGVVTFISIMGGFFLVGCTIRTLSEGWKFKGWKWLIPAFMFTTMLAIAIPNTKDAMIIIGVPYLMSKSTEYNLDKLPPKAVDYINTYLEVETAKLKKDIK